MKRAAINIALIMALFCIGVSVGHALSPCPYFTVKVEQISTTQAKLSWQWVSGLKPTKMNLSILRTPYLLEDPVIVQTVKNAGLSGSIIDTPPQADSVYHYNTEVEVDGLYCQSKRYPLAFGNIKYRPGRGNAVLFPGQTYCPAQVVKEGVSLVNSKRSRNRKLKVYSKLRWAAQAHAAEMAYLYSASYIGFIERVQETGYTPHSLVTGVGAGRETAQLVFADWMSQSAIRRGIRASASVTVGLACVIDQVGSKWWALAIGQR